MSEFLNSRPSTVTVAVIAILVSTALSVVLNFIDLNNGIIDKGTFGFIIVISAIALIFPYKIWNGSKGWMYAYIISFIVIMTLTFLAASEVNIFEDGGLGRWDFRQSILAGIFAIVQLLSSSSRRWLR